MLKKLGEGNELYTYEYEGTVITKVVITKVKFQVSRSVTVQLKGEIDCSRRFFIRLHANVSVSCYRH